MTNSATVAFFLKIPPVQWDWIETGDVVRLICARWWAHGGGGMEVFLRFFPPYFGCSRFLPGQVQYGTICIVPVNEKAAQA